jgi:hypothetical protein
MAVPLGPAGVVAIGRTIIVAIGFMAYRLPAILAAATTGAVIAKIPCKHCTSGDVLAAAGVPFHA